MATAIPALITLGAGIVGGAMQMRGQQQMVEAQKKAEKLRERQMNLQAARERRETIRQAILARSTSLAQTTAQGASAPGSSALGGAYGQIAGDMGRSVLAINQNQEIGKGIFKANRQYYSGSVLQGWGSAVTSIGKGVSDVVATA